MIKKKTEKVFVRIVFKSFKISRVHLSLPATVQAPTRLTILGWRPMWIRASNSRTSATRSCSSALSEITIYLSLGLPDHVN